MYLMISTDLLRWIEHYDLEPKREKELIREGVKIFQSLSPEVRVHLLYGRL